MAYDGKVMRRAVARLEADKQRRAEEFAARRQTLYRMEPKLQAIEQQLRQTMSQIIAGALRRGADPLPAIRVIQDENLDLQRQRAELLLTLGYPMDYLEEKPACDKCGDTGYCGSSVCDCLQRYYHEEQKKELSRLLDLGSQSFDTFSLEWYSTHVSERLGRSARQQMEQTFETCSNFARRFGKHSGNLLLTGRPGVGKTFLSACIAREVTERGFSVVYDTAGSIFRTMEDEQFRRGEDDDGEAVQRFLRCDLLIIDDLGTEMNSSFVQSALYRLLNGRLLSGKSTVINTNLTPDELGRRYSAAILSRIEGSYDILPCYGEDIRLLKRQRGLV